MVKLRLRRRPPNPEGRMSVLDHLRELRRRVIWIAVTIAVGAVVGWVLYGPILRLLEHPYCSIPSKYRYGSTSTGDAKNCQLIYTGVLDGFTIRLKVSVISGAVLSAPLWLYQIWAFVTPGLKRNERKYTRSFIAVSSLLFFAGTALAYLVLARGLRVIVEQGGSGTAALFTVNAYLSFVVLLLVVFGSAFELPLLIVMANLAGVLPSRLLRKSQRISIFLIFVFAAVATPTTDPFTMTAMAVAMCLLFEGAVVITTIHDRRKAARKAAAVAEQLDDSTPSVIDPVPQPLEATTWGDAT
jgi:sec-independent protein translocase protein TatC